MSRLPRNLALLLAGLLQAMPFLRSVCSSPAVLPPAWAIVARLGSGAVALLGSYHAVSGASTIIAAPYTVTATVGTAFSRRLTTQGHAAGSWSAVPNPVAPGLTLGVTGTISGTPTQAGTFTSAITAWEYSNKTGPSTTSTF